MIAGVKKGTLAFIVSGVFVSVSAAERIENPYADVPWDKTEYLHSFSHQHGQNPQIFWDMGYRHLPLSNYYPSQPLYPLPEAFARKYPDAIGGPNAEQHGFLDLGIHFNAIGSLYATGYGYTPRIKAGTAPIEHVFGGLNAYNPQQAPWRGIYRLDLEFSPAGAGGAASAALTVEGATRVNVRTFAPIGDGNMRELPLTVKSPKSFYLKALSDSIRVMIGFDPAMTKITKFRMMQGINRPWRDAFHAALDGTLEDAQGKRIEGLLYPDAGGITINHPTCGLEAMLTLLDFDPRVLGIEVWNHHTYFGGKLGRPDAMPFYELWDDVLRTGRRCYGFFVKDHCLFGRGRNVLLVSGLEGLTAREKERAALRAYRTGCFFGLLGAMSVDASGKVVPPYDNSAFRFTRIAVRLDARGEPAGVDVAVTGADRAKRPHTQIRFVTDKGVSRAEKGESAFFAFPRDAAGAISCRFVRVEAFAYPSTHLNGKPLTHDAVAAMNVFQIAHLHDRVGDLSQIYLYPKGEEPIGIADMIFAQPILVRH
ncbi:MAG: hypothetical protein PHV28_16225 [Kiritimatiellae bacterium]|nr:hypothetical protein [Kiritimatiellia bacterium]